MTYAEVAFSTAGPRGQLFSYVVPAGIALVPGDAVLAPFGARLLPGLVVATPERPAFEGELRAIERRLGEEPLIPAHLIELARWLSNYYLTPISDCASLLLPRGSRAPEDFVPPPAPAAPALRLETDLADAVRLLADAPPAAAGRSLRTLVALAERAKPIALAELKNVHGLSQAAERALVTAGIVARCVIPLVGAAPRCVPELPPPLTLDQRRAVDAIAEAMRERFAGGDAPATFVLHGVTGSGKTEVYLAALAEARRHGRQGIVLVPEIALTPQTVARFTRRFPERVGLVHGRLSRGHHRSVWFQARECGLDVVVGARSALFTPLPHPGLIVVDEEHEPSYKQSEPPPRYHAREAAEELARLTGAVVVLGSATPDVGSYARSRGGRGTLLTLAHRVMERDGAPHELQSPVVLQVVDMAKELREGHQGVLSRGLETALDETLAAGDQALLFLNRRGAASLLLCRDCGQAPHCPRCSVSYALHTAEDRLVCHQCHHHRRVPQRCTACRSPRIRPVGLGTQRLEELLRERYPNARVLRWDGDTATSQARHAEFAATVAAGEVDILVGTQMIAKGHDFPHIAVVGVVSADLSLNIPDFRAAERTFQLLVQVAGRAGRRDRAGRVFIQTYAPDHYAVRSAASGDYAGFFAQEAAFRRRFAYPPYAALSRLVYAHSKAEAAEAEANRYAQHLRAERLRLGLPGPQVVGPAPCYLSRLSGRYRWQILLRGPATRELLREAPPPIRWAIDVDPMDLL